MPGSFYQRPRASLPSWNITGIRRGTRSPLAAIDEGEEMIDLYSHEPEPIPELNRASATGVSQHERDNRDFRQLHGTAYNQMLLELDNIPLKWNALAYTATWALLAGYLVLPGTFTSLRSSQAIQNDTNKAGKIVLKTYQNLGVLWVAAIFCSYGLSTIGWLWWKWQGNYLFLSNRLFQ